jgi:hypothetical protein
MMGGLYPPIVDEPEYCINPASIYAILRMSDRSQNAARFASNVHSIGKKRNKMVAEGDID